MSEVIEYTPESVKRIVEVEPMKSYSEVYLSAGFSWSTIRRGMADYTDEIFTPDLPASLRVYYGPMYGQRDEPTCFVWSIVNGITALGLEPDYEWVAKMLNERMIHRRSFTVDDDVNFVNELGKRGYKGFLHYTPYLVNHKFDEHTWRIRYGDEAALLKEELDTRAVVLTCVDGKHFYKNTSGIVGRHAVCIVGYDICPSENMFVQVLDSNAGNYWLPMQFISRAAIGYLPVRYIGAQDRKDWYQKPSEPRHQTVGSPSNNGSTTLKDICFTQDLWVFNIPKSTIISPYSVDVTNISPSRSLDDPHNIRRIMPEENNYLIRENFERLENSP